MSSYKAAIIGPKSIISGFKALGVTPFDAETGEEALQALKEIKSTIDNPKEGKEKYATVIIIESLVHDIPEADMEKVSRGALPAIVALPGLEGSQGAGVDKLKRLAEKAIGSDILS